METGMGEWGNGEGKVRKRARAEEQKNRRAEMGKGGRIEG